MKDLSSPLPGPPVGKDKGKRAIVMAMVAEQGIVKGSDFVSVTGQKPEDEFVDYHKNMNSSEYEKYMKKHIPTLAAMVRNEAREAVLIVDNAPYHCRPVKKYQIAYINGFVPFQVKKQRVFSSISENLKKSSRIFSNTTQFLKTIEQMTKAKS
ncbi:unnamed protein product [Caenorhabditis bovis]|uniref:Tc1-like transposase DDE domain-containing protein n=1 Tax=Caenorhabditis bovis TaxID=2654633 RepID=A0A8S1ELQ6_9PELO|nr:unnamed protein product [Caenorhabditis bovis]